MPYHIYQTSLESALIINSQILQSSSSLPSSKPAIFTSDTSPTTYSSLSYYGPPYLYDVFRNRERVGRIPHTIILSLQCRRCNTRPNRGSTKSNQKHRIPIGLISWLRLVIRYYQLLGRITRVRGHGPVLLPCMSYPEPPISFLLYRAAFVSAWPWIIMLSSRWLSIASSLVLLLEILIYGFAKARTVQ